MSNWEKALINTDATLEQVISNLNSSFMQIALVVSQDRKLVGTITDGDIRRGLLQGVTMNSPIAEIIYKDPLVVPPGLDRETLLQIMKANKIHQLPIVDENRSVLGLCVWDEMLEFNERSNLMVIMAGGQGARLRPLTENCPKSLLPVGGKPILEHIITRAKGEGFQNFVLAIRHLGEMIKDHFGDGDRLKVRINYLHEAKPLGTAGAIGLLEPRPNKPFLVTNGDVLTDIRYGELLDFHSKHGATATMAVRLYELKHPFGVVHIKGIDIVSLEEKPSVRSHINAGVYVLSPEVLEVLDQDEHCDMPTLFNRLLEKGFRVIVYPMHEPWLDVGLSSDLDKAQAQYKQSSDY